MNERLAETPLVSVVITTKNEASHIGRCLESIKHQQTESEIEIIVVDNFSSDETRKIAEQYTPYVFLKGPERTSQRNFGLIEKARGYYATFLDADMIATPNLIGAAVNKLESTDWIALYVPEIILGSSFWCQARRFERSFYDGTVVDGLRFFRREALVKSGGFDENLVAFEDWDLDKRIKEFGPVGILGSYDFELINRLLKSMKYDNQDLVSQLSSLITDPVIYHNESNFNLKRYWKKKNYYLIKVDTYLKKWGKDDPEVKKQFSFWYRYFGVFFEAGRWKKVVSHLHLYLGAIFLRLLVGLSFLKQKLMPVKGNL